MNERNIRRSALSLSALLLLASCSYSPTHVGRTFTFSPEETSSSSKAEKSSYKILFIGNSFTYYNDIDDVCESLGQSLGMDISCHKFAVGSQKLAQSADPENELGAQIAADLEAHHDYTDIVLQEQSTTPLSSYSSFLSGVAKLQKKIQATQDNADIHLYETWGYSDMSGGYESIRAGEEALREAYRKAGSVLEIDVSYVGKAFTYVLENHPEINLYWGDNKHPSFAGTYLSAATQLCAISGIDVRASTFHGSSEKTFEGVPCVIEPSVAQTLLSVAYDAATGAIE